MTNKANKWIRKKIIELREKCGNKCQVCGKLGLLHFAHIKPTGLRGMGRGRKERYYDIIKHPECYVLACKDCHEKNDRGLTKFSDSQRLYITKYDDNTQNNYPRNFKLR